MLFYKFILSGLQNDMSGLPDTLADKKGLVADLISEWKSSNTVKSFYRAFMLWKSWATSNGITSNQRLPAKAIHVALYLACLVQQSVSPSPVVHAFYGIRWAHSVISVPSPTESDIVKNVLEGARRRLSHSVQKEDPITPELLEKIFVEGNLMNQRIILSYTGFLRVSELLNLKFCDVNIVDTHNYVYFYRKEYNWYLQGRQLACHITDM